MLNKINGGLMGRIPVEIGHFLNNFKGRSYRKITASIFVLLLASCAPYATQLREAGFNQQWQAFSSLPGRSADAETEIHLKVIVTENLPDGWAASYSHPDGIIRIRGKVVGGKIVVPEAVIGHEVGHALQYQDGRFINPDKLREVER
jgi:Zn-dependent membrane protease YugP